MFCNICNLNIFILYKTFGVGFLPETLEMNPDNELVREFWYWVVVMLLLIYLAKVVIKKIIKNNQEVRYYFMFF